MVDPSRAFKLSPTARHMYSDWNVQSIGLTPSKRESLAEEFLKCTTHQLFEIFYLFLDGYKAIALTTDCPAGDKPIPVS